MNGMDQHAQHICPGPCHMPLQPGERCSSEVCFAARFAVVKPEDKQLVLRVLINRGHLRSKRFGGPRDGEPLGVMA